MTELLGVEVEAASSARAAVLDAELVLLATSSTTPVVDRSWFRQGAVVTSIAAGELDEQTVLDATLIPCSRAEVLSGTPRWTPVPDLVERGLLDPHLGPELAEILGARPETTTLTVFLSTGMALWDLVAAAWVDERARDLGLGRTLWSGARTGSDFLSPVPSEPKETA